MTRWRAWLAPYADRRVLLILPLGFSSGLPLLLTYSTLAAWLATAGVSRARIGAFALVGTPYALKFLWSPILDWLPPPIPLGRRRGWGLSIQVALMAAILALGRADPRHHLALMGGLAILVAFLSASQDIVIDAWRVEILPVDQQGPGAGMLQTGYRIAMLIAGAGALIIAEHAGWFPAYATMASLIAVGMLVFIFGPEPADASVDLLPPTGAVIIAAPLKIKEGSGSPLRVLAMVPDAPRSPKREAIRKSSRRKTRVARPKKKRR